MTKSISTKWQSLKLQEMYEPKKNNTKTSQLKPKFVYKICKVYFEYYKNITKSFFS